MIVVLLSWIYIFFTTLSFGVLFTRLFKIRYTSPDIHMILGLLFLCVLSSLTAFWQPLNGYFDMSVLAINILTLTLLKNSVFEVLSDYKKRFSGMRTFVKVILGLIFILGLMQCASSPILPDNESYYIQTVKWLDTFGFVPGTANVHPFLAQQSGWHVLQSALNFDGLTARLNDLSGFFLMLYTFLALTRLNKALSEDSSTILDLLIGLTPLSYLFIFQFIGAPSPDVVIFLGSILVFYYFIKDEQQSILPISLIILFLIYVKFTALPLIVIPLIWVFKKQLLRKEGFQLGMISLVFAALFVAKNVIASGYVFFPTALFDYFNVDWKVDSGIQHYFAIEVDSAYGMTSEAFGKLSTMQRFAEWLMLPGQHGLFNKIAILLVLLVPFLIKRFGLQKNFPVVYVVFLLQLLLLAITSPQYRFFFAYVLFFGFLALAVLLHKKMKMIQGIQLVSVVAIAFIILIPISVPFAPNISSKFNTEHIFSPHSNSSYTGGFNRIEKENMYFHSPKDLDFFWETGDAELPALSQEQLRYFETYFQVIPQLRGTTLKEGFVPKKIASDE